MSDPGIYYEPTSYAWQLEQDRLDREWEKQDLPRSYPSSPTSRTSAALPLGPGAGPASQVVVDVKFLVATSWLPASKLKEQ